MLKNYLLRLLSLCSDQQFGQDAVEWAVAKGMVHLTYDLEADLRLIMGEPGQPETGQYDAIVQAYQVAVRQDQDRLIRSYQPFLDKILKAA